MMLRRVAKVESSVAKSKKEKILVLERAVSVKIMVIIEKEQKDAPSSIHHTMYSWKIIHD